jgi:alkylation response protein AidB-like acyl-CoA dehydrogenase
MPTPAPVHPRAEEVAALIRRRLARVPGEEGASAALASSPRHAAPDPDRVSQDELAFVQTVRRFVEREVRPRVSSMDRVGALDPELIRLLFRDGLMAIEIPLEEGGAGGSFWYAALAIEEIARVDPSVAVFVDVQNALVVPALRRFGTPEQQRRYLPRLARDTAGAFAISEAGAGSDAFALRTRAERRGEGFVLCGRKAWTTNAAEAGLFVVFANRDPEEGRRGLTAFLVEREMPGVSLGRREDKLGMRASSTCEVVLDEVVVTEEQVLGRLGGGSAVALDALTSGRIGIAAQLLGLAEGALDEALTYAQTREQFGQRIAAFQGVRFPLAWMATEIEAARLLVHQAARRRASGHSSVELVRLAAMAKLLASRVAETAASRAVEVFGGNGVTRDHPVEKLYRDAKVGRIYEGTENMQLQTIASTLLHTPEGVRP